MKPSRAAIRTDPRFDFDQGLPDPDLYPTMALAAHFADVLTDEGHQACRYFEGDHSGDMAFGHHDLRSAIAAWLGEHESCRLGADDVLLANGSTNGISLAINALLGAGDALIVEEFSYPYAALFVRAAGATVVTVPVGEYGMEVDQLESVLDSVVASGLRPRMIYTIATFHAPMGTVLPLERRQELIDIARRYDVVILDDNCYYHLWYSEPPPLSLLSLDDRLVIQSGSFSKYIAPALRMAWLAGDPEIMSTIAKSRQDFAVSQITARVVERFVSSGQLDEHLVTIRSAYRAKRDLAEQALRRHCGDLVRFRTPTGGLYFWLEVDPRVDFDAAMKRSADLGVRFRPGVQFFSGNQTGSFLRLSVAQSPAAEIDPGIELLGLALKRSTT